MSGPQTLSVRALAHEFAARLGRRPHIVGEEAPTAWLTNTERAQRLFGPPAVSIETMLDKFLTDTDDRAVTPIEPETPNIVGPVPTYVPVARVQN